MHLQPNLETVIFKRIFNTNYKKLYSPKLSLLNLLRQIDTQIKL